MTQAVRNRASDIITALGGAVCRPMAVRRSESTTMMRVKLVTITRMEGASERMVISPMSWIARSVRVTSSPKSTEMSWPKPRLGMTIRRSAIAATASSGLLAGR